jgi:pyruvate dehydrogenase E1 component alpha subunit
MSDRQSALEHYRIMLQIRMFEEKSAELYSAGKIRGFLHLYVGEEAIASGVIPLLSQNDAIVSTYRDHGHALARGLSSREIMAEMFGKVEGCCKGRGGSMHLFSAALRLFGGNAIVAGGIPLAVGLALADKLQSRKQVTACFFGDGAVAEGAFHESMNLAALWKLPVLFVCENNRFAMGTALEREHAEINLSLRARAYGIASQQVDGMDVNAVAAATKCSVEQIREGHGPHFIEFLTYRFRAHSMYDPELYRTKAEVNEWKKRDPILLQRNYLHSNHWDDDLVLNQIELSIEAELKEAVDFAEKGHLE